MLTRTQRQLKAVEQKMEEHASEAKTIIDAAASENRDRTEDEDAQIAEHHTAIKTLKENKDEYEVQIALEKEVNDISKDIDPGPTDIRVRSEQPAQAKSVGEMFVASQGYKDAVEAIKSGSRAVSTGAVAMSAKGTLVESAGSGLGLATTVPQVAPGVVDTLFQRLTVADLLASGQATTSSIRYVVEGTATSGAAGVAEGGDKPQSTLNLSTVDEPVKKIATSLVVSDEMLEDAAQVQSYINGRLALFVKIEEERQLLLGGGTNDLVGITGRSGVNTYARGTVDNYAVALFKALNGTRGSAHLEPDGIILNPADWQVVRLLTDSAGQFFGGGPFQGPYGSGQNIGASGAVTGAMDTIWNKPVVVTTAIGAGTALLGSFGQAAQVYRRGGLSVEATNSHSDYFTKNLVAIRAEERLALAVYRPGAFTKVVF